MSFSGKEASSEPLLQVDVPSQRARSGEGEVGGRAVNHRGVVFRLAFLVVLMVISLVSCDACEDTNPWGQTVRRSIGVHNW